MLFLMNELAKAAEITILSAQDTTTRPGQKHILLADKSEFGWSTIDEYKQATQSG